MTTATNKVLEAALALPEQERRIVMEALADSLVAAGQAQVDDAWRLEVLRRIEQVRRGEVELESWEEVRRAMHEALARR